MINVAVEYAEYKLETIDGRGKKIDKLPVRLKSYKDENVKGKWVFGASKRSANKGLKINTISS